jgi:hypothetical protein
MNAGRRASSRCKAFALPLVVDRHITVQMSRTNMLPSDMECKPPRCTHTQMLRPAELKFTSSLECQRHNWNKLSLLHAYTLVAGNVINLKLGFLNRVSMCECRRRLSDCDGSDKPARLLSSSLTWWQMWVCDDTTSRSDLIDKSLLLLFQLANLMKSPVSRRPAASEDDDEISQSSAMEITC